MVLSEIAQAICPVQALNWEERFDWVNGERERERESKKERISFELVRSDAEFWIQLRIKVYEKKTCYESGSDGGERFRYNVRSRG